LEAGGARRDASAKLEPETGAGLIGIKRAGALELAQYLGGMRARE
jgi:hypothetical protein